MSETATDENANRRRGLLFLLASVAAGLLMSWAAAATIVSSNAPSDSDAVSTGQQTVIAPAEKLNYGS
ncbi:MAG TPA: hypothetical protein PLZ92_06290 [Phycicoccus sp.]|jgi:multidrug resistance efflux pump|nr:hypothetical protein [Phycicoccus sp.]